MADTRTRTDSPPRRTPRRGYRAWVALIGAAVGFALIPLGILPQIYAMPLIGLVLAFGAAPDHVPTARALGRSPRNWVLVALVVVAAAVVVLQPQLLPLAGLIGADGFALLVALATVAALALPLAMTESAIGVEERREDRFVLTKRNLILSLTVILTVATWYAPSGTSFLAIAQLVLAVPLIVVVTRLLAARRHRLQTSFVRHPFRAGYARQRWQLLNVLVLCALLAVTPFNGVYDAPLLDMSASTFRVLQAVFVACLVVLVLLMLVPLRRVRLGSNLLVLAGTVFVAAQLAVTYAPAASPVVISSPLADEWYVGQGGHSELVNYHRVTSTQSHALDIMEVVNGRTHPAGHTDLASYYVFNKPVLAPADGVVTYVLADRPDHPVATTDNRYQAGNHVVIDIGGGRYVMMGHLHQGSVQVGVGDRVRRGQAIARVGNSGNTTEPHIHIQAQSSPSGIGDITQTDLGALLRTVHTYPLEFRNVVLTRHGSTSPPGMADPRRGDLVRPVNTTA